MKTIVDVAQNGFIKSRQAVESILIVRAFCRSLKAKGCEGLILKLDFKKVYDIVDCNFLFQTLNQLGFRNKWISWISWLYDSIRISVLINGSPTKECSPKRGIRQGTHYHPCY